MVAPFLKVMQSWKQLQRHCRSSSSLKEKPGRNAQRLSPATQRRRQPQRTLPLPVRPCSLWLRRSGLLGLARRRDLPSAL